MTMITPSYLGETIEYSSLHACRSTLEDPIASADGDGERTVHRPHCAVERQFTHEQMMVESRDSTHGSQNAEGHGKIKPRAFFAHVGRGQIDGDGLIGIAEAGVDERGLDAFPALAHRCIRHPDRDEVARRA